MTDAGARSGEGSIGALLACCAARRVREPARRRSRIPPHARRSACRSTSSTRILDRARCRPLDRSCSIGARSPRRTRGCSQTRSLGARPRATAGARLRRREVKRLDRKALAVVPTKTLFDVEGRKLERGRARRADRQPRRSTRVPDDPARRATASSCSAPTCARSRRALRAFNSRGRSRHRSLPGERAVSRHAGGDRAREPRSATGGSSSARCMRRGSRSASSPKARRTTCSPTRARRRISWSPAPPRRPCSRPSAPEVSELQLDMGVRVPVLADWPASKPVNGQHPYTAHVIELPVRARRRLAALHAGAAAAHRRHVRRLSAAEPRQPAAAGLQVPRRALRLGPLLQCARLQRLRLRGVPQLRRPAAAQHARPGGHARARTASRSPTADDHERRLAVLRNLEVGDLVYIPGHVMMVIGHDNGMPYVIHDTTGISYRDGNGGDVTSRACSTACPSRR